MPFAGAQEMLVERLSQPRWVCVLVCVCSVVSNFLQPHELQPSRLLCSWDYPDKNIGAGCHFFQSIFLPWGSNPCFYISRNGRQMLYRQCRDSLETKGVVSRGSQKECNRNSDPLPHRTLPSYRNIITKSLQIPGVNYIQHEVFSKDKGTV